MNRDVPSGSLVDRYAIYGPIARGGMATVFFGRLRGPAGFSRTVAIKRLHPQFAAQPELVSMFVDEARLATRVRSPHVVSTLDVVATGDEVFLVMDYVAGESLARLARVAGERGERIPVPVTIAIVSGVLQGLHAAHEARGERGEPLGMVHRDVSPQNILVGTDGLARVLDFGVAKAAGRLQSTRDGELKGKLSYMPPEQLRREPLSRRGDVYAASVVLWEALTGERLFGGDDEGAIVTRVLLGKVTPPSRVVARGSLELDEEDERALERLDPIVLRGLDRDPGNRFETAGEMAIALERAVDPATPRETSEWVEHVAGSILAERAARLAEIESGQVTAGRMTTEEIASTSEPTTVAGPTPAPAPETRGRRGAIAAIAAAGLLGVGLALLVRARGAPSAPAQADLAATSTSAESSASAPPPVADAAASIASAIAPPPATAPPPSKPAATAPKKQRQLAADCNPPFSWDAAGEKHYKAQCL